MHKEVSFARRVKQWILKQEIVMSYEVGLAANYFEYNLT